MSQPAVQKLGEIAADYGLSPSQVRGIAASQGIKPTDINPKVAVLTAEQIQRVRPFLETARSVLVGDGVAVPA